MSRSWSFWPMVRRLVLVLLYFQNSNKFADQCFTDLPGGLRHNLGVLSWCTQTLVRWTPPARRNSRSGSRDPGRRRDVSWHDLRERGWFLRYSVRKASVGSHFAAQTSSPLIPPGNRTGDLRFRLPEPYGPYSGVLNATKSGPSCTQLRPRVITPKGLSPPAISYASGIHAIDDDSEDCKSRLVRFPDTVFYVDARWFQV